MVLEASLPATFVHLCWSIAHGDRHVLQQAAMLDFMFCDELLSRHFALPNLQVSNRALCGTQIQLTQWTTLLPPTRST